MSLCAKLFSWLVIVLVFARGVTSIQVPMQNEFLKKQSHSSSLQQARVWPPEFLPATEPIPQEESQAVRNYLKQVYPMAAKKFDGYSDTRVMAFMKGLTYYYEEPLPIMSFPHPMFDPGWKTPLIGVGCATKLQNLYASLFKAPNYGQTGQLLIFESVGDLLKHTKQVWDTTDFHKPESWPDWMREAIVDNGAYIEVVHFGGNSKKTLDKSQPEEGRFLGAMPWTTAWFYKRRGSGIFYKAGRSKTAINKNHMLLLLWKDFHEKYPERVRGFYDLFADIWSSPLLPPPEQVERAMDGTLNGEKCTGLFSCWNDWNLRDGADEVIVWLGRELAYDTLIFAASPVDTSTPVMELVDLRLPVKAWIADAQKRRYQPKDTFVRKWMQSVRDDMILSIRDPFDPNDMMLAQPCEFQLASNQLYCNGTISETLRFRSFSPC